VDRISSTWRFLDSVGSTTVAADGSFAFTGLPAGAYQIQLQVEKT
jgi:hypothetical protein